MPVQPTTEQFAEIGRQVVEMYDTSPQWWHDNLAMVVVWKIEEFRRPTHYATFGSGHPQAGCYSLLHADSFTEAHDRVMAVRGREWSHLYPIEELAMDIQQGYLSGGEVPL